MSAPGWALDQLAIPALWAEGLTGRGLRVGHLDTGVAARHPALLGRVAAFRVFHRDGLTESEVEPIDSGVHGTQTAAILCGGMVQGIPVGVAPDAQLVSGMVIEGGYSLLRVLMGLAWLPAMGVRVLCLSLGVAGHNPVFKSMIAYLRRQGILIISPVGNAVAGQSHAPGNYEKILSVGAVDWGGRVAAFSGSLNSHYGLICNKPDLLAPGVDVATLSPSGELVRVSGTSMAAAYVAGIALLMFQSRPQSSVEEVESALVQTTRPVPAGQTHRSRAGLVDPRAALAVLHAPGMQPSFQADNPENQFMDPRLLSLLRHSAPGAPVTVLLVVAAGGCMEHVLAESGQRSGESLIRVQHFPDARTACITASRTFVEALLEHEQLLVASAPDIRMT
jgi:subtilisin